ncbi:hypothetical protein LWI29_026968 [Acer saccharum]|uniref:Uncharacterized protein n=1 Tax=Acer saccharum TaxID=4024 RepID=A0AA39W5B3_ACESA|nr:hypothetical protein LWI29_026968 [Acer saccharum]
MKQLSNLDTLEVNNCNMLLSLTGLPLRLRVLSAIDCKMLYSISLDASELVEAHFMFTNCPNLEKTAVGKILATVERYEGEFDLLSFCCPGSEVPRWFSYKSNESSIKFRMAYNDLLQGFILCAVIEFEKYRFNGTYEDEDELFVKCRFSNDGGRYYLSTGVRSCTLITKSGIGTLIDSDHVALWYFKALGHQVLESQFTNCSFDIWLSDHSPKCRVKSWGVRPITKKPNEDEKVKYAELIKIFDVTDEDIGETSRKRSRTSNEHWEEEVEPHLKITIPDEVSDEDSIPDEDSDEVFRCFGQYFCLHFTPAPVYIAFLWFMGHDNEAKNYSYSLEAGGNRRKMIWQGVPHSIRDSHRKVCDSFDGLVIQCSMALFFSGAAWKELKLRVTSRIWKEQ